jgi:hypothetical protein
LICDSHELRQLDAKYRGDGALGVAQCFGCSAHQVLPDYSAAKLAATAAGDNITDQRQAPSPEPRQVREGSSLALSAVPAPRGARGRELADGLAVEEAIHEHRLTGRDIARPELRYGGGDSRDAETGSHGSSSR